MLKVDLVVCGVVFVLYVFGEFGGLLCIGNMLKYVIIV